MTVITQAPFTTTLTSLVRLSKHIRCIESKLIHTDDDRKISVSRNRDQIIWINGVTEGILDFKYIEGLDIHWVHHGSRRFLGLGITLIDGNELLTYRLITSPESDLEWFFNTSHQIGELLGVTVNDES